MNKDLPYTFIQKDATLKDQIERMRNCPSQIAKVLNKLADSTKALLKKAPGFTIDSYFKDLNNTILYGLCEHSSVIITKEVKELLAHRKHTWEYVLIPEPTLNPSRVNALIDDSTYDLANMIANKHLLGKTYVNSYEFCFYPQEFSVGYNDEGYTTITYTPATLPTGEDAIALDVTTEFDEDFIISYYAKQGIKISTEDVPEGLSIEYYEASLISHS